MSDKRTYLKDPSLDKKLAEEGYVVVPFLTDEEVSSLKQSFQEAHPNETVPFYATAHHQDPKFRKEMSRTISSVLKPHAERYFNECDLLGASFIAKLNSDQSLLQPHQDWNIVDENKFRSFNLWIPLVDLTPDNGAIEVLPKSHNWIRGYRHSSIDCAYRKVHNLVWQNMKPLYLKAGDALIYDHSMLHASKANSTNETRIACASGLMPKEAQMLFYWNNKGTIAEYESNPEFFMTQNIFDGPNGLKKVADIVYGFPTVEAEQFYQFIGKKMPEAEVVDQPLVEKVEDKSQPRLPFWKVYTPINVLKEIHYRLTSKD